MHGRNEDSLCQYRSSVDDLRLVRTKAFRPSGSFAVLETDQWPTQLSVSIKKWGPLSAWLKLISICVGNKEAEDLMDTEKRQPVSLRGYTSALINWYILGWGKCLVLVDLLNTSHSRIIMEKHRSFCSVLQTQSMKRLFLLMTTSFSSISAAHCIRTQSKTPCHLPLKILNLGKLEILKALVPQGKKAAFP